MFGKKVTAKEFHETVEALKKEICDLKEQVTGLTARYEVIKNSTAKTPATATTTKTKKGE